MSSKKNTVYKITCLESGKSYIGVTCSYASRIFRHLSDLEHGRHRCAALQEDYNKFGAERFSISALETGIPEEKRLEVEDKWIRDFQADDETRGYNKNTAQHDKVDISWTGEIVSIMHVNRIKMKDLAAAVGWHEKYLSAVLNGKREGRQSERRIRAALDALLAPDERRAPNDG